MDNTTPRCVHWLTCYELIRELGLTRAKPVIKSIMARMRSAGLSDEEMKKFENSMVDIARAVKAEKGGWTHTVGFVPEPGAEIKVIPDAVVTKPQIEVVDDPIIEPIPDNAPTPGCNCKGCVENRGARVELN